MRELEFQYAFKAVMLIGITAAVCVAIYTLAPSAGQPSGRASSDLWVSPVDDLINVTGPVTSVLVEVTDLSDDGLWRELDRYRLMEVHYDASGRIIKRVNHNANGRSSSDIYLYDDKGRLIKVNYLSAVDGVPYLETTYTYDGLGRPSAAVSSNIERGSLLSKAIYTCRPEENYTEVAEYWGETLRTKTGYFRGARGRVVEQHHLSTLFKGKATPGYAGKTVFTYDEKGGVIQELSYDADDKLQSRKNISYEYDSYGNWVKRVSTTEDLIADKFSESFRSITYRTITYNQ